MKKRINTFLLTLLMISLIPLFAQSPEVYWDRNGPEGKGPGSYQ